MHGAHATLDIIRPVRPTPIQSGGGLSSLVLRLRSFVERALDCASARFHESTLLPRFDLSLRPGLQRSHFLSGHAYGRHQNP